MYKRRHKKLRLSPNLKLLNLLLRLLLKKRLMRLRESKLQSSLRT